MNGLLSEYLIGEALIIIPVLLIIGKMIKDTPQFKDWIIPYVLLGLGIVFTVALLGFNIHSIIQGVLVAGAAVFGNQLYRQTKVKGR